MALRAMSVGSEGSRDNEVMVEGCEMSSFRLVRALTWFWRGFSLAASCTSKMP
jgi:hypothetical protein